MKAVILAAGNSSRMYPYSDKMHKSEISLLGKPIIYYTIKSLVDSGITEFIIVTSKSSNIKITLNNLFPQLSIIIREHAGARGMGESLLECTEDLKDDFLLVHAHHINAGNFVGKIIEQKSEDASGVLLLSHTDNPREYGIAFLNGDYVKDLVEKPLDIESGKRIIGIYLLEKKFFDYLKKTPQDHYSFETALSDFCKDEKIKYVITADKTISLKYPWELLDVSSYLLNKQEEKISNYAEISKTAVIEGKVHLCGGVKIDDYAVIKGPCYIGKNTYIGTHSIIRSGAVIEENSVIGANMEIKNSIIMKSTTTHSGYIGDSVIGENCKIAAGFCTGNVRLDRSIISSNVKKNNISTHRKSLGVIMGSNVSCGIRVSTMPGIIVGNNSVIGPSSVVFENIDSNKKFYRSFSKDVQKDIEEGLEDQKKISVLFDIDYTIFDTKTFKESGLRDFVLYEEVSDVINQLFSKVDLGIFSEGSLELQRTKLIQTSILKYFFKNDISIVENKDSQVASVVKKYSNKKLVLVDDKIDILLKAKSINPEVITVWVKRGPFAESAVLDKNNPPTLIIENLYELLPLVSEI